MSYSKAITETDLTNILNEIGVGATLVNGNETTQFVGTGATTITTTNTEKTVLTLQHNTVTGRILCIGRVPLMTSRYTSTLRLRVDGVEVDVAGTNKTTDDYITLFAVKDVSIGSHTVNMTIQAQDSGTTATVPGYRSLRLYAIDLEKGHYNSAIQMADYIVEQGTSGVWMYRKWNSGRYECEAFYNFASYAVSTARGSLYSGAWVNIAFPSSVFTAAPNVTATLALDTTVNAMFLQIQNVSSTGVNMRLISSGSVAANSAGYAHIQAVGRWK